MKRTLLLLALLLAAALPARMLGNFVTRDGVYYDLNATDRTATVVPYGGYYTNNGSNNHEYYTGAKFIRARITYNGTDYTVTSIAASAFQKSQITSIVIPSTVTSIGGSAFSGCTKLKEVWCLGEEAPTLGNTAVFYNCHSSLKIHIPSGSDYSNGNWADSNNPNSNPIDERVILNDGVAYTNSTALTDTTLYYARDFEQCTVWRPLYVPFSSSYSEWRTYFVIATLAEVTYDPSGDQDVLHWYELGADMELRPGFPYIIKRRLQPGSSTSFVSLPNTSDWIAGYHFFSGADVAACADRPQTELTGQLNNYAFGGVYAPTSSATLASGNAACYALNQSGQLAPAPDGGATLSPNRVFLIVKNNDDASAPGAFKSVLGDGDGTLGIIDILGLDNPLRPADPNYYDLLGRRVAQPRKGHIYIHNHQKIIY